MDISKFQKGMVSVLIVTWNRKDELIRCINSALTQSYRNVEIVIVDNGSTDGTGDMVNEKYPDVLLVRSPANLGCPLGRNLGFANCRGEFIYCLDDDGWLKPDALEVAVSKIRTDEQIAVVQSQIHEMDGEDVRTIRPPYTESLYVNCFSGGCSLFRKEMLDNVGYYPEDFVRQAEEEDLALRFMNAGYFCVFEPASIMFHASSPLGRNDMKNYYYTLRNTLKIGLRRWPAPWNILRVIKIIGYSIKCMVQGRSLAMPILISGSLLTELLSLKTKRSPVKSDVFNMYIQLKKRPSPRKPASIA